MRRHTAKPRAARAGFTLVEVLVTLVLIALLVGVVLPAVIGQLGSGEPTRLVEDLESVRTAGKMLRIDAKRWPSTLEQLMEDPGTDITTTPWDSIDDVNGADFNDGLIRLWNGPYLETGKIAAGTDSLPTILGGWIGADFSVKALGSNNFWTIHVFNLDTATIRAVSEAIDGNDVISNDDAGGRVRAGEVASQTILYYLAAPIN